MIIYIYQVDAFADKVFKGNAAAVCPLLYWLPDSQLLQIAAENNLSETAFYVPKDDGFEIRWFTPSAEVDLCGHATLAAAYVVSQFGNYHSDNIHFYSPRSGKLPVTIKQDRFVLNFPMDEFCEVDLTDEIIATTDRVPLLAFKGKTDYMLVYEDQSDIEHLQPNLGAISNLNARGIIVTAKGDSHDFVSRFFGPAVGVDEDPVTGSAHTTLAPYWAGILNKSELSAAQLSKRGGELTCQISGNRVELAGRAALYLKGEIYI
ncbi:PhzF family phenazine biosynthesis protein [Sphingobacterium corticibacter]|uniref:Isomerase n=1 Tax=Sphingobacterium corticibacter TaxID=2171749 RepID=A0A2T8HFU7_9SPHI|nr:PhzF family phenazine biosynthesis protein [Sphingobacterium corticibacter]PVH24270.1 isomerase [Sphingobacterium corticibacter]